MPYPEIMAHRIGDFLDLVEIAARTDPGGALCPGAPRPHAAALLKSAQASLIECADVIAIQRDEAHQAQGLDRALATLRAELATLRAELATARAELGYANGERAKLALKLHNERTIADVFRSQLEDIEGGAATRDALIADLEALTAKYR